MIQTRVPWHNNLDQENGWQTSTYHPSGKHQEQTANKNVMINPYNRNIHDWKKHKSTTEKNSTINLPDHSD